MFNYGAPGVGRPPPPYGQQPHGMAPPGMAPQSSTPIGMAPPGMGAPGRGPPPGMVPPGTSMPLAPGIAPPGVQINGGPQFGGPRPLSSNFQRPAGMANINFSAPVIRLGTGAPQRSGGFDNLAGRRDNASGPPRRGLGMDGQDMGKRDEQRGPLHPPTREEISRTIFVGNIPKGVDDQGIEAILRTAGSLTRFYRATDANNKAQTFGFAEYSDAQSLRTAVEIFQEVEVPTERQEPGVKKELDEAIPMSKLQIVVDDASVKYAEAWTKNDDETTLTFRNDTAREALQQVLLRLANPPAVEERHLDTTMTDASAADIQDYAILDIDLPAGEDELDNVPAEMRETVKVEIAAFRDHSIRRDKERLRREEELESAKRRRASPPPSAPTGPGGVNGVPVGPKAQRGLHGDSKGGRFPSDYQGGVNFINGGTVNGAQRNFIYPLDENDSADDSELEGRRKEDRSTRQDAAYREVFARYRKTESRTISALKRTDEARKHEAVEREATLAAKANALKNYDDDEQAARRRELYYNNRDEWKQGRVDEHWRDKVDREAVRRQQADRQRLQDYAMREADAFLEETGLELQARQEAREKQSFKISLGAATKKLEQTTRRTADDVEMMLDGEEAVAQASNKKRTLVPINFDATVRANLTQEEIEEAQRQLARDIPNDAEGLWNFPVSWEHLPEKNLNNDIKEWVTNKVFEHLGVQEDLLIDAVMEHLKKHGGPQELIENLEVALDDDAESLVRKLWRMVIYYSETEKRGIK